ncbi:hypothetical protein MPDQ_006365 [Monascus purpureus]|uniref:Altered inheritance of mitochondria protein 21 n=1 Tax=Monascus purpureus TaxID=5098 RepID=A0A507QYP1_MONPU|nr:hypothetical protein MPDQ_006365 [Monascus purpureus]BDD56901.1 hypothetical protein MAP00_002315 [Monascus purpureus]
MTAQTAPVIPPRPSRSPNPARDTPKIPPRPASRRNERSTSPLRDSYAPSPLNELPNDSSPKLRVSHEQPQRPPSVVIPSLGEEGREYEDLHIGNIPDQQGSDPRETRTVASDLKLHAPRPSLPQSSATTKIQAVTRTDSTQAAAAGFGKRSSPTPAEQERSSRSLHSRNTSSRTESSATSSERRKSLQPDGIPEIGQRVPMYPNAGDVQAPSVSPYTSENDASRHGRRHHHRSRSGRELSLPPGSYGLHGHGINSNDKFEKAWYEKHPDEYAKEEGQYGPGVGTPRPDWALSRDDLNKIVRSSATTGSGLGTSPAVTGTPEEEIGYIASEEYASRLATPALESRTVDSPLRNVSVPASDAKCEQESASHKESGRDTSEKTDVIHVDDPYHPLHHPDGFAPTPASEDLPGSSAEGDLAADEPILAPDEVRPESAFLHPAISPTFDRRPSADYEGRSRTSSAPHSRSSSRPTSTHGALPRTTSHEGCETTSTPLDDVEEYEPLFPEDSRKVLSPAERFKQRPDGLKQKFPSEDIWEDSPNSFHLQTTVSTPEIQAELADDKPESPYKEVTWKELAASQAESHGTPSDHDQPQKPTRPDHIKQRFPSRDIWEDAPESQTLVTTIVPSEEEIKSPEVPSKPSIPPRPQKRPQQPSSVEAAGKQATSPTEERKPPVVPGRPKPLIPARPSNPVSRGSSEGLTKVPSAGSTGSVEESKEAPAPKPKPAVPARPIGGKIAALRAGFLSDLNSRLQTGPQAPPKPQEKKEESTAPPAEKGPLNDARKGRARGPARRKPASEATAAKLPTIPEIQITSTWNVWQIDEDGRLVVGDGDRADKETTVAPNVQVYPSLESTMAPKLARNMAGEPVDPSPQVEHVPAISTEMAETTPHEATKPTSPPPAEHRSPSPVLDDTVTPASDRSHESAAVELTAKEDLPKITSPDADSDIEIETKQSPELFSEAVENVEPFTGKRVSEEDVHVEESS